MPFVITDPCIETKDTACAPFLVALTLEEQL